MRQVKKKRMRKVIVTVIMVLFLLGCATTPISSYRPPYPLLKRFVSLAQEVRKCVAPDTFFAIRIVKMKEPNAWIIDDKIYFTESMFNLDDNTLKFIMAHEMSHGKLGHITEIRTVSYVTTGAMMVVNVFVPGAGYLNHVINPAVCNNYSKTQELEADKEASKACLCLGISIEQQVEILENLRLTVKDGGGFWDRHPSWDDRIANIKAS